MSEIGEVGAMMRADRQARHAQWAIENVAILRAGGFAFEERQTACLFRVEGKPAVDFYQHTGRWRVVGRGAPKKVFRGGAVAFLAWFRRSS